MDENTWRFAQLMMWVIGLQTTVIMAAFGSMWIAFSNRFDKIDDRFDKIDGRADKFEGRLTRIENDMIEVKTILRFKESCMLSNDHQTKKKAE